TNILIVVDENFTKFETKSIGTFSETRGFSSVTPRFNYTFTCSRKRLRLLTVHRDVVTTKR
uniref:Uncharacterized protein n=1 Tax=Romanomermis culicivorax TaxID=13658 RepID=A0A915JZ64_ROMCU